jgi:hypothetical protein
MAIIFQIVVIWILTPCGLVGSYRRFGGICCPLNISYTVPIDPNRAAFPFQPLYNQAILLAYTQQS